MFISVTGSFTPRFSSRTDDGRDAEGSPADAAALSRALLGSPRGGAPVGASHLPSLPLRGALSQAPRPCIRPGPTGSPRRAPKRFGATWSTSSAWLRSGSSGCRRTHDLASPSLSVEMAAALWRRVRTAGARSATVHLPGGPHRGPGPGSRLRSSSAGGRDARSGPEGDQARCGDRRALLARPVGRDRSLQCGLPVDQRQRRCLGGALLPRRLRGALRHRRARRQGRQRPQGPGARRSADRGADRCADRGHVRRGRQCLDSWA